MSVSGLVSLSMEHAERLQAERTARASQDRLNVYADLATDWLWEANEDFVFQNLHGAKANDGQTPAEYVGKVLWEVEQLTPFNRTWDWLKARVRARKRIYDFIVSATQSEGDVHYAEIGGLPRFDAKGGFVGFWGTAKDVTQRVKRELALARSEERYRSAVHLAGLGSWVWDELKDCCSYCSPELAEIYGVTVEQYLDRSSSQASDLDWFHPLDRERYFNVINDAIEKKSGYEVVARIVRDDGSVRTLHEKTEPVFDDDGRFVATSGVLRDITEQQELQGQLLEKDELLNRITASLPVGLYRTKFDGKYTPVYRSPGFERYFLGSGVTIDDPIVIHVDDRQCIRDELWRSATSSSSYQLDYRVVLKDGTEKWVNDQGRFFIDQNGDPILEGIILDVTERHISQQALTHKLKLESIGKLTGGIAHDFNNLLAIIIGNLEILDDVPSEERPELLAIAKSAAQRGADLTKSMLAFARRSTLNKKALDLNEVATKAHDWITRTLPSSIDFCLDLETAIWPVNSDESATQSALLNLIVNARDVMSEGGRITVRTRNIYLPEGNFDVSSEAINPGRYVLLSVEDNGSGISTQQVERIFEPFYTTKGPGHGSGLGLSMVMGFVKQLGGHIRVESSAGKGAKIEMVFPATFVFRSNVGDRKKVMEVSRKSNRRVLVVEDDEDVRQILRSVLTIEGHCPTTAKTALEAISKFGDGSQFDLLITDIVMPGGMLGTDLASQLRRKWPELPIIFLSGYSNPLSYGLSDFEPLVQYLQKPATRDSILEAIDRAIA